MLTSPDERFAVQRTAELEPCLAALEDGLRGLASALCANDASAIEARAAELHRALARAVTQFSLAARTGGAPAALRQRLAIASAQVAAQREALARATAALDRAIDVLMPDHPLHAVYGASGLSDGRGLGGSLVA